MALLNWPKNRFFIVSPYREEDTLWQLCKTVKRGRIVDIYDYDMYDVIAGDTSLKAIKRVALKKGSKNPKII